MDKIITYNSREVRELLRKGYKLYWVAYWDTSTSYTYCLHK